MNTWIKLLISSILTVMIIGIGFAFVNEPILADDDYDKNEHYLNHHEDDEDEGLEEGGELLGWGTAIAVGGAVILMPLRRNSSKLMKAFPDAKGFIKSVVKFFSKSHIWIGVLALTLSGVHGIIMFLDEGKLDFDVTLGIISFGLMVVASLFGVRLLKNKSLSKVRSIHFGLLFIATFISVVHIFIA